MRDQERLELQRLQWAQQAVKTGMLNADFLDKLGKTK